MGVLWPETDEMPQESFDDVEVEADVDDDDGGIIIVGEGSPMMLCCEGLNPLFFPEDG